MLEIQNIVVKLASFTLRSIAYVIVFILKLADVSSMWKLMQMTQMDVIRFARWRELGLIGISFHVNMRIRHRN